MKRKLSRRYLLNLTFACNAKCFYCYFTQQDGLTWPEWKNPEGQEDFTLDCLSREIDQAIEWYGAETFDLFGGEPTLNPDLDKVIQYIVSKGCKSRLVTNGLRTSSMEYLKPLIDAGLEHTLLTLHGPEEVHDDIVGVKGAYKAMVKTYENLAELGVKRMTNIIISRRNYKHIPWLAEKALDLGSCMVDFINIDTFRMTEEMVDEVMVTHTDTAPYVKEGIDIVGDKADCRVRYVPYCLYRGYEHKVVNWHQMPYDPKEWDFNSVNDTFRLTLQTEADYQVCATQILLALTERFEKCKSCNVNFICMGVRRETICKHDPDAFKAYHDLGPGIKEPLYFVLKKEGELDRWWMNE